MSYFLTINRISCIVQDDYTGQDEIYVRVPTGTVLWVGGWVRSYTNNTILMGWFRSGGGWQTIGKMLELPEDQSLIYIWEKDVVNADDYLGRIDAASIVGRSSVIIPLSISGGARYNFDVDCDQTP